MRRVAEPRALLSVTGLILAGGQGQRMCGRDKGLLELGGQSMIAHVIERLRPQVNELLISANRHLADYQALGCPVIADHTPDYTGPLAGMLRGLEQARSQWLVTVPCDSPFLPHDLVRRLRAAVAHEEAIAVVHARGELQPVFALIPTCLAASLQDFLRRARRKITDWYGEHLLVSVDFSDQDAAFDNINTEDDRLRALARLSAA